MRESKALEGNLVIDHIHILLPVPLQYIISEVVGYIKDKSGIHIVRTYPGCKRNYWNAHLYLFTCKDQKSLLNGHQST